MAVYGNYINENVLQEKSMSLDNLLSFIQETTYDLDIMFEKANFLSVLREDNEIAVQKDFFKFEPEEVKKTFVQKAKEIIQKFIKWVKDAFIKLSETLHKKYMETNLTDKFISQYKNIVTYDNLKEAREKGWKGTPVMCPMINKIASPMDSKLYDDMNSKLETNKEYLINVDNDIEPIVFAENFEKAKEIYDKFQEKLKGFKSQKREEEGWKYKIRNSVAAQWGEIEKSYFVITGDQDEEGKFYFPNLEGFVKTKKMAEEGQAYIKQYKYNGSGTIKNLKIDKEVAMDNLKSYKKGGSNNSNDNEINKIMMMYYRARYQFTAAYIERSTKILNSVIEVIKFQHNVAIQCYLGYVAAIKKYAKPSEA